MATPLAAVRQRRRLKVLIADDSDACRERLLSLLRSVPGIGVLAEARDGAQAEKLIEDVTPDVVILDIRMPAKDGITLLQEIRHRAPSPVVIMLTNYPYPEYRKSCLAAGADYFFEKTTEFEKVVELLAVLSRQMAAGDTRSA